MARDALIAMTKREIENLEKNRIDLAPDVMKISTSAYSDPERFKLEVDRIFRRVPLALGFSSEFRNPGDYRALTVAGMPVIIVRGADGELRAFVNMCSHRGNFVIEEGSGNTRRFRCNYHAWTYTTEGRLFGVFEESNFGCVNKAELGLTPLPIAERAGLVWVTLNPESTLDIDLFLDGYGEILEHLRIDDAFLADQHCLNGPNWKVAYDGYRDFYHVPILHRQSFGPDGPYQPDFYAWGPHVRVATPKGHDMFKGRPEAEWTNDEMMPGVWTIFPNVSIAGGPGSGYMFSMMFPGKTVGESFTIQNFLRYGKREELNRQDLDNFMGFMRTVVGEEDYKTGFRVQTSLATGAKAFSYFGRNEGGGQLFHKWVDAMINTSDADLPELFRRGVKL